MLNLRATRPYHMLLEDGTSNHGRFLAFAGCSALELSGKSYSAELDLQVLDLFEFAAGQMT